ncbi:SusC/RagA family TonB-linked outer membrane protein [Maribellus sp. YY47]|uniref:SusC/RagA family TonB-linked outer membrane protein n=1 Tax=Maribellus sp. YY47 TaxID=2929486 RepID=UPI0020006337|nr:SusC/RagA family TonB-linked outer membrane protein [Maribellus sp. YY47]MCK3684697.1 SusC/RagA family TonB-linked outer membrane protein [Maribellus sp. YY47]
MEAQTTAENETDTIVSSNEPQVQVAYRKVAKSDILGGVSVINLEELTKKNYNTYSLDNMQGYIGGYTGSSLWGMGEYLVLVDGIPRDANNVLPTEIEQISFLKSAAATVLYGSRAAKGVIYISTKRGKNKPLEIGVRANTGLHLPKSNPKYLGSAQYMTMYNEARANDELSPLYSDEDIYNYASGLNPYRYPNIDFYSSDYLKKTYNRTDVTTEIAGGNERARFYTNIGYYRQGDLLDFGEAKDNFTDRLNIRGNIDLKLNKFIDAYINANATFYNSRSANATDRDGNDGVTDNYWTYASVMRPNRVAPLVPLSYIDQNSVNAWNLVNGSANIIDNQYFLGGSLSDQTNVFADYYATGYSKWTSRQFQFDTGLDFDLGGITEGLAFHTQFAVDYSTSYTQSYNNKYAVFEPQWYNYNGQDVIGDVIKRNNDEHSGVQNISGSTNRQTIAFSGYFTYDKTINDVHNLSAMLVAAGYQRTLSGEYHRPSNANLGLQVAYNYKQKYYADFGMAAVHSAKLPKGNRNAMSPSLTLGWNLAKEDFLESSSVIDDLTWSVSGSILNSDLDIDGYYLYLESYTQADGAWWGWYDGANEQSTNAIQGGNKDLTFVKRKELSTTLGASLWNNLLKINTSFFINSTEGLIIQPNTIYPNYFFTYWPDASFIPNVNFNNDRRAGIDFNVELNKKIGEVDVKLGVSGMYYTTKATKRDENYEYAYQNRQGQPIDGRWGLESMGLFQSQEEIDAAPEQTTLGEVKPGDIRYVDQNNDNIIDNKDIVFLGKAGWSGAPLTTGLNLTLKWKNFTFFALGTGHFGAYSYKNSEYYWAFGERKYSEVVLDRWTEETKATATYPRLTTKSGSNNFRDSDFWMYKTNRLDLAKVQLTYDLPKSWLKNSIVKELSAYINGSNLLTISKEREVLELNTTSAPQARFYSIGVKALF